MLPKAILLDLDDTIISFDYGVDLDVCWKNACMNHFPAWSEAAIDDAVKAIKKQAQWYWSDADRHRTGRLQMNETRRHIVETALTDAGLPVQEEASLLHRIADEYGRSRDEAITLFPGAVKTLEYIRALGMKLALITNGSSHGQRSKIDRFQLSPYFDDIFIEEECGIGKPEPGIYHMAMKTWIIGDNFKWEIEAPQALGIKGVWVNHREMDISSLSVQPYYSIKTLSDIVRLLNASTDRAAETAPEIST